MRFQEEEADKIPFGSFQNIDSGSGYKLSFNTLGNMKESSHSLGELFERYGDSLWEQGRHRYNVEGFIHEMDDLLLSRRFSSVSESDVDELVARLRERGNSNATINRKMAALSKLLRKALRMGDLDRLPEFPRQKERAGRIRFLERDEEERLFGLIAQRSDAYRCLSEFLVDTGARLGEAIGMRWGDIGHGKATFWITKSGRSRTIPLTARAIRAVEAQRKQRLGPFLHIQQYKYRAAWNEAKKDAGLHDDPEVVPHVLRHTCASRLVQGGVDIRRVQTWLGHRTLQMTMRYSHLATNDLDICVPVLERIAQR